MADQNHRLQVHMSRADYHREAMMRHQGEVEFNRHNAEAARQRGNKKEASRYENMANEAEMAMREA